MSEALKTFIAGVVAIGMATAVLLPGRQTIGAINAGTNLLKGTLGTAISGKS